MTKITQFVIPKQFKITHNLCCKRRRKSRYFCGRILARILCSRKVYEVFHVCQPWLYCSCASSFCCGEGTQLLTHWHHKSFPCQNSSEILSACPWVFCWVLEYPLSSCPCWQGDILWGLLRKLDSAALAFVSFFVAVFKFVTASEARVLLLIYFTLVFPLGRLLLLFLFCLGPVDPLPDLLLGAFACYVMSLLWENISQDVI